MSTLQTLNQLTDYALHLYFFSMGFLLSACLLSHTIRFIRLIKKECDRRRLTRQIEFLMSADYIRLYKRCKELGLCSRRETKLTLCHKLATYQMS